MRPALPREFSPEQERAAASAVKLEWLTLAYLASVATLMYLVLGSSQAMKTAWTEDLLSFLPPIMFLVANRYRNRAPTEQYPYGFHRIAGAGFLVAAVALLVVGGLLVVDSALKLVQAEHPTIGMRAYFGIDTWLGWWMIAVLAWGTIPPVLLGRAKMRLARPLFDKVLYTDAKMNKADWLTSAAAIAGVLGVGFGLWWADAAAALFIAIDILHDGVRQTRDAITGLMDRAPKSLEGKDEDIAQRAIAALESFDWVERAAVRLREEGHLFFGEGYYLSRNDAPVSPQALREAVDKVKSLDWRLQDFALTPMAERDG